MHPKFLEATLRARAEKRSPEDIEGMSDAGVAALGGLAANDKTIAQLRLELVRIRKSDRNRTGAFTAELEAYVLSETLTRTEVRALNFHAIQAAFGRRDFVETVVWHAIKRIDNKWKKAEMVALATALQIVLRKDNAKATCTVEKDPGGWSIRVDPDASYDADMKADFEVTP